MCVCVCVCVNCVCVCVVCVCAGAVRAALNDHNVEHARAPKHRERRRAPPPRALAWVGSTRCGAQHALSCVAPAVAEPTAARTGAEWLPDRAWQAQSHRRGANANRAVAVRRSRRPPAVSRTAVQPYSRQLAVAVAAAPAAAVSELLRRVADAVWTRAAQRRASVLGVGSARARADGACKQTACTAHSFKIVASLPPRRGARPLIFLLSGVNQCGGQPVC